MREDDSKWPPKNKDGMQELAIKIGKDSISFQVSEECVTTNQLYFADIFRRPQRSGRSWTCQNQKTQKVSESSTISHRISERLCFR